jgi:hypothetical protein
MQQRHIIGLLWLTALLTVPVPYFAVERGVEPVARLLLFAAVTGVVALSDPDFGATMFATLFLIQCVGYAALLYVLARVLARRLERVPSAWIRGIALAAVLAALVGLGLSGTFVMPFARSGRHGSVLDLLE